MRISPLLISQLSEAEYREINEAADLVYSAPNEKSIPASTTAAFFHLVRKVSGRNPRSFSCLKLASIQIVKARHMIECLRNSPQQ